MSLTKSYYHDDYERPSGNKFGTSEVVSYTSRIGVRVLRHMKIARYPSNSRLNRDSCQKI